MTQPNDSSSPSLDRRLLLGAGLAAAVAAAPTVSARADSKSSDHLAMRRPSGRAPSRQGAPAVPPAAIVALNRMGFGPRPGDIAAFNALGGSDPARMAAYVAQQLDPSSIDDSEVEGRLAAAGHESIGLSNDPDAYLSLLWDYYINNNAPSGNTSSSVPHDELIRTTFLRAVFSRRQLQEVLVGFWHDHFNVYIDHSSFVRATLPHLDLVIRQQVFGNFRQLLEAVTRSTAMLYYLDNYTSSNGGPNENFSRELFELHTLGAENYLGIRPQIDVPRDGQNRPIGYVDADVFEATRCFTGWSFSFGSGGDGDTGLFYYRSDWHDRFQKNVLGRFIPQDQAALNDGRQVLDELASHPGTGRHIARKLCRRLIADDPPQSIIDSAAAVFTAQWQSPTQLKQVYETILLSDEFRTTWGEKIKRPFDVAASALRATGANFSWSRTNSATSSFLHRFDDTGHEPFHWPAPNGFPDVRDAWQRMTPRLMSWRLLGWMVDFESSGVYPVNVVQNTPASARTANEIADYWIGRILGRAMAAEDRDQIVQFMAQGINPDFELNLTDKETCERLRAMVGLILMSPDFSWR